MSYAINPPWAVRRRMMMSGGRRSDWGRGYGSRRGYPMGPGPFFGSRPKVSRGEVRIAILHLLGEEPMHGYQIMSELTERTDGIWRPSPGSIYPTLNQLEDEGLVSSAKVEGKNVYSLTDAGANAVTESESAPPWERFADVAEKGLVDLRDVGFQVGAAVMQVARAGSKDQVAKTQEILEETRRRIYEVLAEDTA